MGFVSLIDTISLRIGNYYRKVVLLLAASLCANTGEKSINRDKKKSRRVSVALQKSKNHKRLQRKNKPKRKSVASDVGNQNSEVTSVHVQNDTLAVAPPLLTTESTTGASNVVQEILVTPTVAPAVRTAPAPPLLDPQRQQ